MSGPSSRPLQAAQTLPLHLVAASLAFALVCIAVSAATYAVGLLLGIGRMSERVFSLFLYGGFVVSIPPALLAAVKTHRLVSGYNPP